MMCKIKYFITIFVLSLLSVSVVFAYTLSWQGSVDATGYKVYYNSIEAPDDVVMVDRGSAINYDLDSAGLTTGTRYEFWVTAYNETGESPESDHIRWTTPPGEPIIIEMLGAPVQIIINP